MSIIKCPECGKDVSDTTKVCIHCGFDLTKKLDEKSKNDNNTNVETKNDDHKSYFFLIVFILLIVSLCFFVIYKISSSNISSGNIIQDITEREITASDYSIKTSQDLMSYSITITTKRKITRCTVKLTLYDKNSNVLYSNTLTKEDLLSNSSYTYTFDFGFMNSLSGSQVKYNVTGKCNY